MKKNGMLLHISSLPSDFGIGDFGPNAYQFVDYLNDKKLDPYIPEQEVNKTATENI